MVSLHRFFTKKSEFIGEIKLFQVLKIDHQLVVGVGVTQGGSCKKEAEIEVLTIGAQKRAVDRAVITLAAALTKWRLYSSALIDAFFTEIAAILGGGLTVVARGRVKVVE